MMTQLLNNYRFFLVQLLNHWRFFLVQLLWHVHFFLVQLLNHWQLLIVQLSAPAPPTAEPLAVVDGAMAVAISTNRPYR